MNTSTSTSPAISSPDADPAVVEPSELAPLPELEEVPQSRSFEVWARIKKSSKYYYQGLVNPYNPKSKARFFKLNYFTPPRVPDFRVWRDQHCLHFNGNAYRLEDCELYLRDAKDETRFVRIV